MKTRVRVCRGCKTPISSGHYCPECLEKIQAEAAIKKAAFEAVGLVVDQFGLASLPAGRRVLYSEGSNPELPIIRDGGAFPCSISGAWVDADQNCVRGRLIGCDGYGVEVVIRGTVADESPSLAEETETVAEYATDQYGNVLDGHEPDIPVVLKKRT